MGTILDTAEQNFLKKALLKDKFRHNLTKTHDACGVTIATDGFRAHIVGSKLDLSVGQKDDAPNFSSAFFENCDTIITEIVIKASAIKDIISSFEVMKRHEADYDKHAKILHRKKYVKTTTNITTFTPNSPHIETVSFDEQASAGICDCVEWLQGDKDIKVSSNYLLDALTGLKHRDTDITIVQYHKNHLLYITGIESRLAIIASISTH